MTSMKGHNLKVKVCGMKHLDNIGALLRLKPDMIGFIFYEKSPRFVHKVPKGIDYGETKKVGVFVNEKVKSILDFAQQYSLDYIQLHGSESPKKCSEIKKSGFYVIKAFSVDDDFDFRKTRLYESVCDLFLFDTKGAQPGGNGKVFDWEVLNNYEGDVPFLLSGGISNGMQNEVLKIKHPQLIGVDVNSGFEIAPGLKNIRELQNFIYDLRNK